MIIPILGGRIQFVDSQKIKEVVTELGTDSIGDTLGIVSVTVSHDDYEERVPLGYGYDIKNLEKASAAYREIIKVLNEMENSNVNSL